MRMLVTGSTGLVGSYVVAAGLAAGHEVTALVRPASRAPFASLAEHPLLRIVRGDLRDRASLSGVFEGIDVVVHLAATKAGDFATQFASTVVGTENLLDAMAGSTVSRLVAISTFSVYDYTNLAAGSIIDEQTPIDTAPALRDEYAQTKLIQERLYRSAEANFEVVILRPGMVYGRDNLWHALLGSELGPLFLKIGGRSTLPMTYVENCADAIVAAVDAADAPGATINIVDDNLPTQAEYVAALSAQDDIPKSVPVPWPLMRAVATGLATLNKRAWGGRAKFPGIVVPERLDARFKPFRYSNDVAKKVLGWTPRFSLDEAFRRSLSSEDLVAQNANAGTATVEP